MFNKKYFDDDLPSQILSINGGAVTVFVHLRSGEEYKIAGFVKATEDVFMCRVYPPDDRQELNRIQPDTGKTINDEVAIPYDSIDHLYFTITDPSERTIGFGDTPRVS